MSDTFRTQLFWITLGLYLVSFPCRAQISLDGSLGGTSGDLTIGENNEYTIDEALGTQVGSNLFHSFGEFNVNTGESATFTGISVIENILSRVTGGNPSNIDGTLGTDFPNATPNLYLLNPAGILFGANASLNVQGSFHATTADYIGLQDGTRFNALPSSADASLTTAPPAAFGFLGENPAPISIDRSQLEVPENETLSIIGGDIQLSGDAEAVNLRAPSGQIDLVSVASPGEVVPNIDDSNPDLAVDSFEELGEIGLSDAIVTASGAGGGTILIRGGRITAENSNVFANTNANLGTGDVPGAGIDIQVTNDVVLASGTAIGTNVVGEQTTDDSGGVHIKADSVELRDQGTRIESNVFTDTPAGGSSGDIEIEAKNVTVRDGAFTRANTDGVGDSGDTIIETERLEVKNGGSIFSLASGGTGNAGGIQIKANDLEVKNNGFIVSQALDGTGNAGDIEIESDHIVLSSEAAPGALFTAINSGSFENSTGNAGNIRLRTENLQILDGSEVSSFTQSGGNAGNVEIMPRNGSLDILISGAESGNFSGGIFTNTFGSGNGGHIQINADNLEITRRARLAAGSFSTGTAGGATITLEGDLIIREGASISTRTARGTGDGADLNITARNIEITGIASAPNPQTTDLTGITTDTGDGQAGNLSITAQNLLLKNSAQIRSNSEGAGNSSNVSIMVSDTVSLTRGGTITTFGTDAGDAGDITVKAGRLVVSGVNDISPCVTGSTINTQAQGETGNAGNITIDVDSLEVLDGANIQSRTLGKGQGGDINITAADRVLVSGESTELADSIKNPDAGGSNISTAADGVLIKGVPGENLPQIDATGDAGNIVIDAEDVQILNKGSISAGTNNLGGSGGDIEIRANTVAVSGEGLIRSVSERRAEAGDAGDIMITATEFYRSDGGFLSSAATGDGQGNGLARAGSVKLVAGEIQLSNGAFISARNTAKGDAGDVLLVAGDSIQLLNSSNVTTEAKAADGGNIKLTAPGTISLTDSQITSSVGGGATTVGGNISIDPEFVVLNRSQIRADAKGGKGGNVRIVADQFLASADSSVTASSERGIDGEVVISSPEADIISGVTTLAVSFLDASSQLSQQCAARSELKSSSFVVVPRSGIPPGPEQPLRGSVLDSIAGGQ